MSGSVFGVKYTTLSFVNAVPLPSPGHAPGGRRDPHEGNEGLHSLFLSHGSWSRLPCLIPFGFSFLPFSPQPPTRPPSGGVEQDEPAHSYSHHHDLLRRHRSRHHLCLLLDAAWPVPLHPDLAGGRGGLADPPMTALDLSPLNGNVARRRRPATTRCREDDDGARRGGRRQKREGESAVSHPLLALRARLRSMKERGEAWSYAPSPTARRSAPAPML